MRVHLRTKRIKATAFECDRCSEPIKVGESYFEWKHNHRPVSRRHQQHGGPRTSELCTGKMSGVYAAVEALEDDIAAGRKADDPSGLEDALNQAASSVREVADEYEQNIDNMPEGLQSSPTAEDMREKSEALNEFADALENAASEVADWDMDTESPEPGEDHSDDCAVNDEDGEEASSEDCNCGFEELTDAKEEWERERDEKIEEAFTTAENAAGELSI